MRGVRHGIEYDHEFGRQLQRHLRLLAGRQFDGVDRHLVENLLQADVRQVDARAPEDLAEIFQDRQ
jgi:hypothetical protein